MLGHDVLGGDQAAHRGQHHVHGHHVGAQPGDHVHRLAAVDRLADDLELRVGGERLAQVVTHGRGVLDQQDTDHQRISLRMWASSSSWLNSPFTT